MRTFLFLHHNDPLVAELIPLIKEVCKLISFLIGKEFRCNWCEGIGQDCLFLLTNIKQGQFQVISDWAEDRSCLRNEY